MVNNPAQLGQEFTSAIISQYSLGNAGRPFTERQQLRLALSLSNNSVLSLRDNELSDCASKVQVATTTPSSNFSVNVSNDKRATMKQLHLTSPPPKCSTKDRFNKLKYRHRPLFLEAKSKLLDISDRVPFSGVKSSNAKVWIKFDRDVRSSRSNSDVMRHAIWFSNQLRPTILKPTWHSADWQRQCASCDNAETAVSLLEFLEREALDWARVIDAWTSERGMRWDESRPDSSGGCGAWVHFWPRRPGIEVPGRSRPVSLSIVLTVPSAFALPPPSGNSELVDCSQTLGNKRRRFSDGGASNGVCDGVSMDFSSSRAECWVGSGEAEDDAASWEPGDGNQCGEEEEQEPGGMDSVEDEGETPALDGDDTLEISLTHLFPQSSAAATVTAGPALVPDGASTACLVPRPEGMLFGAESDSDDLRDVCPPELWRRAVLDEPFFGCHANSAGGALSGGLLEGVGYCGV